MPVLFQAQKLDSLWIPGFGGGVCLSVAGDNIRAYRKKFRISQAELSRRSGISQSAISDIENKTKCPSIDTLRLIADALRVTVSELIGESKENSGDAMEFNVGNRIKKIRLSLNLTQNVLAKRAGIGQSTLSAIESTTKSPNTETVRLIANALGLSVSDLIDMDESKEATPETGDSLKAECVFILNGLSDDGLKQAVNYLRYLSKCEETKQTF